MQWGDKKHELNVSTYHMCILLLFNEADKHSYRDILSATGIPSGDLKRALQSLALVKVSFISRSGCYGRVHAGMQAVIACANDNILQVQAHCTIMLSVRLIAVATVCCCPGFAEGAKYYRTPMCIPIHGIP